MRLISCHIENFGKLTDQTISFDDPSGITMLYEENGWGKSTLAVFIKVMFFDFDNDGKRNDLENERKHYKPWQGGTYGGQVTFEAGGKTYILSRTFGVKSKDDEILLQDAETKLESADFSKENIGEELFQIDRASFNRSFFVSQNDCAAEVTDRINAKLGNLADSTDDLNNYETAAKKLSDKLNALSRRRKTGELYKQREQMEELKQEIRNGAGIDASMEELAVLKNKEHDSYDQLKQEQKALQERQRKLSAYKDIEIQKREYERLCREETEKQKAFEEAGKAFPGKVPEQEEIRVHMTGCVKLSEAGKEQDIYRLKPGEQAELASLEKQFSSDVPSDGMLEEMNRKVKEMQTMRHEMEKAGLSEEEQRELQELSVQFADGVPEEADVDRMINRWNQRTEKKNVLSSKKATASMLQSAREQRQQELQVQKSAVGDHAQGKGSASGIHVPLVAAGLIIVVIGLILCTQHAVIGGIAAVVGILAAVLGLIIKAGKIEENNPEPILQDKEPDAIQEDAYIILQEEIAEDEILIEQVTEETQQFMQTYHVPYEESGVSAGLYQLKERAKKYKQLQERSRRADTSQLPERFDNLQNEVQAFLGKYGADADAQDSVQAYGADDLQAGVADTQQNVGVYETALRKLEQSARNYRGLKEKQDHFTNASKVYDEILSELKSFLSGLSMELEQDIHAQLQTLADKQKAYVLAEQEWNRAEQAKRTYQQKTENLEEILKAEPEEPDASLSTIENRLREISEQLEVVTGNMNSYDRRLDELQQRRDDLSETEQQLEVLQEAYAVNEKKFNLLEKTRDYLEQAKIALTAKYTKPIKDGFDKYYRILAGIAAENYQLDANMDLSVVEQGMPRDIGFLSNGYQDLAGICMRMALVDAMYQEEKPFIVFDDPFVNLDQDKLEGALQLLREIAKEYQVIYFTCHESRRV